MTPPLPEGVYEFLRTLGLEHAGERPIAITWRLRRPMPAATFRIASVVA
jgi:hypothetical protein